MLGGSSGTTGCVGAPQPNGAASQPIGAASQPGGALSDAARQFPLDTLSTSTVRVRDAAIHVWLAQTPDEQTEGLMFVREEEIADDQGMLFVFPDERVLGFWMRNTLTPLDIAFARMDGTIVAIHTMPALTLRTFSSFEPATFALEVKAGVLGRLGVEEGDRLDIPAEVFKPAP
jgi:hypothetical protein